MSIPPLVCSTPPPLEQVECEDISGQDDFGVQYSLSQEDDDDLSTYENYQISRLTSSFYSSIKENSPENQSYGEKESNLEQDSVIKCENISDGGICPKTTVDEDNNIEDLDLKFEPLSIKPIIKEDSSKEIVILQCEQKCESQEPLSITILSSGSLSENGSTGDGCNENISIERNLLPNHIDNTNLQATQDIASEYINEENHGTEANIFHTESSGSELSRDVSLEKEELFNDFTLIPTELNLEQEILEDLGFQQTSNFPQEQIPITEDIVIATDDDDFNDFNTFHLVSDKALSNIESVIGNTDNDPWKSDEVENSDFGDFQATFDNDPASFKNENLSKISDTILEKTLYNDEVQLDDDDDFGDFDNFKSSNYATSTSGDENNQTHLSIETFNFEDTENENQIYENIEKSIHSIFDDAVMDSEGKSECSLESTLCETWGYLTETEIRQPYMVNWNNSIGQKSLLKSLSIDSRNILFGPKWNNMPRYAANLGPAPLQPLKPVPAAAASMPASHCEGDKPSGTKPIESWSEAVAHEGQETCNDAEKASSVGLQHVIPAPREFDQQVPPGIFPRILTPRQISLPDTHIFTPTDSEVPRSKTIHYDNFPPIAPQMIDAGYTENGSDQNVVLGTENECDDFQDFQDTSSQQLSQSNVSCVTPVADTHKSGIQPRKSSTPKQTNALHEVTYQTQTILEPIKLEPTMPKLNWPEPGEVKETFDDFSDFVSNSSWSSVSTGTVQNLTNQNVSIAESEHKRQSSTLSGNTLHEPVAAVVYNADHNDDDFDNFQFAQAEPTKPNIKSTPPTEPLSTLSTPTVTPPQVNGLLSPMVPLKMQSSPVPPPKNPQILHPIPFDRTNQNDKSNTQQILQPLTLESFSQINWPSPGVDLQDLSRFNPIHALHSLHQSPSGSKGGSPAHGPKSNQQEDDGWGDFVSIKPSKSPNHNHALKPSADEDDWSDFMSSTSKPPNGVNTISFNVHTNLSAQKPLAPGRPLADGGRADVPTLNYITPKNHRSVRDSHFQNL